MAVLRKHAAFQGTAARNCNASKVVRVQHGRPQARAAVVASSQASLQAAEVETGRRSLLLGAAAALAASPALVQLAAKADTEYATFYGLASPPTSYGGYGGNAKEAAKYSFEYPSSWKLDAVNKVEKGTQGIDGRVINPRGKDQRAFVITLGRAGEDNANFAIKDAESTFAGFAGADYNIMEALSNATSTSNASREVDGVTFVDYDIDSPEYRYLSSIAVKGGKVFALFVRSPSRTFGRNEADLRHIVETFKLL